MKHKGCAVREVTPAKADHRELSKGVIFAISGAIALAGLFGLTRFIQLNSLLVVSQAIYNVLSGVKGIAEGIGQLLLGLVQMIGFAVLAVVAVLGVLALASGSLRISLKLLPQLESIWNMLARGLNHLTLLVCLPQLPQRTKGNSKHNLHDQQRFDASASRPATSAQRAA